MSTTIDSLQIEITQNSQQAVNGLDALTASLGRLKTASKGGVGLTAVSNQLKKLNDVVNTMQDPSTKISQLVSALKPLESIGKSNLNSTINSLKKLPELTKQLAAIDMGAFATQIDRVVSALKPLATEMNKIAAGFSAFPSRIQKLIIQNEKLSASNAKAAKSFGILGTGISRLQAKFGVYYLAFRKLTSLVRGWISESNNYVENLNLFRVSMGEAADEALDFAYKVRDAFGVDPSEWIRYQAVFQNMATGFGIVADKATVMSKGLTQLGYDLATLFNVDYDVAMRKLESAIAGQPRPMREWGFDISETTLKMVALNHGIKKNVELMTQNEKAQLRYIQLMETAQKQGILGNFAREVHTPANALRILNQQLLQLRRALGDMIIPILMKIIPYIQAFVKVITDAVRAIATLFGFKLPKIDYSGLEGLKAGAEAATNAIGDTTAAVKKLKSVTTGFDELNIIPQDDGSGGGSGSGVRVGGVGKDDLGLEIKAYEGFLSDMQNKINELAEKLRKPFEKTLKLAVMIGVVIASWKIASGVYTLFTTGLGGVVLPKLVTWIGNVTRALFDMAKGSEAAKSAFSFLTGGTTGLIIAGIAATVALVVARVIDLWKNSESFRKGLERIWGVMKDLFGFIIDALRPIGEAIAEVAEKLVNLIPQDIRDAISNFFKQMDLDWKDLGITALGFALLFVPGGQVFGVILLAFEAITLAIRGLGAISEETWDNIKKWFSDGIQKIKEWFTTMFTDIAQFFVDLWQGIVDVWNGCADWFNDKVIQPVANFFLGLWDGISSAASTCWNAIVDFFSPAIEWFSELFGSIFQTISDIFYNIGVIARGCWEIIKAVWGIVSEWFNEHIITPVSTFFSNMWNGIKTWAIAAWDGIKSVFSTIGNWMNEKVIQPVAGFFSNLWNGFVDKAKKAWEGVKSVFSKVATFFSDTFKKAWQGIVKVFSIGGEIFVDIKDGVVSAFKFVVNELIKGLNKVIAIPFDGINSALNWIKGVEIFGLKPFDSLKTINIPQIPLLAEGGFPATGQIFIAREAGPELVGSIGSRTAVANNDQIVEAVSQGVFEAVVAAMPKYNEQPLEVKVYLDGKEITKKVEKIQRERGTTLLPGGVAYGW